VIRTSEANRASSLVTMSTVPIGVPGLAARSRSLQVREIAVRQVDPAFNMRSRCLLAWSWRSGEAKVGGPSDQSADEGIEGVVAALATVQGIPVQDQRGKLGA
jgi:hypothetical protein